MKYASRHQQASEQRRSGRMDLSPYMIEDVAMTLGELESARNNDLVALVAAR